MKCKKKGFNTPNEAQKRVNQINKENKKNKNNIGTFRFYKCDTCNMYHLTKMEKKTHKFITDPKYRKELKLKSFLKRETEYWKSKFGIDD